MRPAALFTVALLAFLAPAASGQSASGQTETLAVTVEAQVVAADREATALALSRWADESGGYFTYRSADRVTLRVPDGAVTELRPFVERLGDEVLVYNPATADLRARLREVDASIASRREALGEILGYLEDSDVAATLAFERELRSLNAEIEQLVGLRRVLRNRVAFARVEVALATRERGVPRRVPSSFEWINDVDLYRFVDEMGQGGSR